MKELWQLIKMLFSSKPGDFDTPELLPMKHYPFKGYRFMMWCGRMDLPYREQREYREVHADLCG